ncbi:MAG: porin family protein [Fermentimonas sp.]|jgi:hypothetical protein
MKRFSLFLICTALGGMLFAQKQTFPTELYIGGGAGGVAANVSFVPSIPQTLLYSYQGGIAAKYVTEKHLGLITEVNLTRKGWREEFEAEKEFAYERTLTYIDVPFMTHVYFGNKTRFVFNAGPQISVLIGENVQMNQALSDNVEARKAADPNAPIGVQYGPMSEMKRVDYGLIGGAGLELRTAIGVFNLEGRYYFGLGDIFTSRRSDNAYFTRSAHRVIMAKLTYYIQVK